MTNTPPATIHLGDCIEVMRTLPENCVDAIVTDPPYGLGFMGKAWDELPPGEEWARECLRVLKPGGHLLAFGGSRTWHRLAVAVEDAGFEVRDSIAWLYGSGFPKSLDVSKAIDKRGGADIGWFGPWLREERRRRGVSSNQLAEHFPSKSGGLTGCVRNWELGLNLPTPDQFNTLCRVLELPFAEIAEAERQKTGRVVSVTGARIAPSSFGAAGDDARTHEETAPATPAAQQWQGFGTALKPAFEPIVVARKPLVGTVAANVLTHGTGALNIDGCRVEGGARPLIVSKSEDSTGILGNGLNGSSHGGSTTAGRWPANVVLDESQAAALDQMSGVSISRTGGRSTRGEASSWDRQDGGMFDTGRDVARTGHADSGGASRFFYVAKAPTRERPKVDGVAHPTVKPLALMRWLVRLVTPPGGTVLEPFAGSGTTVEACALEGFACIAIEREPDYLPLIQARLARVESAQPEPVGPSLFDVEETA